MFLWPEPQTSGSSVCAAASQTPLLVLLLLNPHSLKNKQNKKNKKYPSPSRYTWVSLHTGRTKPMVHSSLQRGRKHTETWDKEVGVPEIINYKRALSNAHHLGHTHLSGLGKSMPSSMLSCLLQRVETMIRYLTRTGLTDSSCTACRRRERKKLFSLATLKKSHQWSQRAVYRDSGSVPALTACSYSCSDGLCRAEQ